MLVSTAKPVTNMVSFLMLPDDLLLSCLARVSKLHYPTLSLVSKKLRSLLASHDLYKTRSLLGRTEISLYVCLQTDLIPTWFTLCQRPIQITDPNPDPDPDPDTRRLSSCFAPYRFLKNFTTNKEKKLSENLKTKLSEKLFVSVPTRNSPYVGMHDLITVGYNIYKIGIYICGLPTAKVLFMDCRSHTWHEAPSMQIARRLPAVSVLDGKIYVAGGNKDCDSSNWIEFFDPKTQVWEYLQIPTQVWEYLQIPYVVMDKIFKSLVIDGNLYLFGNKDVVYKPKENRWDVVDLMEMCLYVYPDPCCVIDNILYAYELLNKLQWYDSKARTWRDLKGLERLPELPKHYDCVKLVNYGGNLVVLWKDSPIETKFWCAEISFERRNGHEIHGKIEWCDVVLTAPKSCLSFQILAVTL